MLAVDGDLDGIETAGPGDAVTAGAEVAGDDAEAGGVLVLIDGVAAAVAVDKDHAGILIVGGDDDLPTHVGGDINLVGNGAFADGRVAGVDDDVGVHLALPGVGGEIEEVDAEIDFAIGGTAVTEGEGNDVAGVVAGVGAVNVGPAAAVALVIFVKDEKVLIGPVGELADTDGPFAWAAPAAGVGLVRMGAVGELGGVVDAVVVRITGGAVDDVAGATQAEAVGAVVERIEAVVNFPAVGHAVLIGVGAEGVGFGDDNLRPAIGLAGAVAGGGVGGEEKIVVDGAGGGGARAVGGARDGQVRIAFQIQ